MAITDCVKDTSTSIGTGNFVLSGTAPIGFQSLSALGGVGTTFGYKIENGAEWEVGIATITAANTFSRAPSVSSNAGALVNFSAGTKTVFHTVTAAQYAQFLTAASLTALGTSVSDYLAATAASAASGTDLAMVAQGNATAGMSLASLATFVHTLWASSLTREVRVTTTAQVVLDFTQHNRKRLVFAAVAPIAGPSGFGTVGNEFSCEVINVSGGTLTFGTGISCLPSGSTLVHGASARLFASNGTIYALMPTVASSGAVIPGQVTGLATSAPNATGVTLNWTAPATGTSPFGYTVQSRVTSVGGAWTTLATGVSATTYATTGQASSTGFDYQVAATNSAGTGTYSSVATGTTSAAPAVPAQVTGLAHGTMTSTTAPLTWNAASGATTYKAQYRVTSVGGAWTTANAAVSGTSYTITGLTASTGYDFQVIGTNTTGDGTPSAIATGTTAAAGNALGTGVAPFTATARNNFPAGGGRYTADYCWHDITTDGAPTITSVSFYFSTSNTEYPTDTIGQATTPMGDAAICENYGGGTSWLVNASGQALAISWSVPTPTNFYFWIKLTDSSGTIWWFRRPGAISMVDGGTNTFTTTATATPQVVI